MKSTSELLDLARLRLGGVSDYRLAKTLGINPNAVSNYRTGVSHPANPIAARLAALAGVDPDAAVCWVNIERSRTDADRETWLSLLSRVQGAKSSRLAA